MTTYFYNPFTKEVSDIKESYDFTETSKEGALELLDLQNEDGNWIYWNKTDLKRYDERPFDKELFLELLNNCVAVYTNSVGVCLEVDKTYLTNLLNNETFAKCEYTFHKSSNFLFVEKIVLCTVYNSNGFKISTNGDFPTGSDSIRMIEYIKSLNENKGTFKMQVERNGFGKLLTINFEKIES